MGDRSGGNSFVGDIGGSNPPANGGRSLGGEITAGTDAGAAAAGNLFCSLLLDAPATGDSDGTTLFVHWFGPGRVAAVVSSASSLCDLRW